MARQSARTYRRRRRVALAAVVLAAAGTTAFALVPEGDGLAPGVEVAGVDLGQRGDRARTALVARGRELSNRLVRVRSGGHLLTVMRPADLGGRPLVGRAIQEARRRGPGRFGRLARSVTGRGPVEVRLRAGYRSGALQRWIDGLAHRLDRSPTDARVAVRGTDLTVVAAEDGQLLDRSRLREIMTGDLEALPETLDLPVERAEPGETTERMERAAERGRRILAAGGAVVVDGRPGEIPRERLARALVFADGEARVDRLVLRALLRRLLPGIERAPRPARFVPWGERVRIVPSRDGQRVDAEALADELERTDRPARAGVVADPPPLTTQQAESLGIRERVATFTTEFTPGQPRVTNITIGARALDGTIVRAGESLSLNEVLGERTEAKGYVPAPQIVGGIEELAVGGGVSQIATTLFNAAFFAGLEIVEHTPHQLYISRYPPGREATISWGGPELVIRNDWNAAVLVDTVVGDASLTVNLYSQELGRRVETETGAPFAQTEPEERTVLNEGLAPGERVQIQPGSPGFSIEVSRTVFRGRNVVREEVFRTTYAPDAILFAVGPGTPDPPPEDEEPATTAPPDTTPVTAAP